MEDRYAKHTARKQEVSEILKAFMVEKNLKVYDNAPRVEVDFWYNNGRDSWSTRSSIGGIKVTVSPDHRQHRSVRPSTFREIEKPLALEKVKAKILEFAAEITASRQRAEATEVQKKAGEEALQALYEKYPVFYSFSLNHSAYSSPAACYHRRVNVKSSGQYEIQWQVTAEMLEAILAAVAQAEKKSEAA
jgi:hypothetical protein